MINHTRRRDFGIDVGDAADDTIPFEPRNQPVFGIDSVLQCKDDRAIGHDRLDLRHDLIEVIRLDRNDDLIRPGQLLRVCRRAWMHRDVARRAADAQAVLLDGGQRVRSQEKRQVRVLLGQMGAQIAADGSGACAGVVCALGDWNNGWALYVVDGRPAVAFSLFGALHRAVSSVVLSPGRRLVRIAYERARDRREGGGAVHLGVEGDCVAELELPHDLPFRWQIGGAGLHIGVDRGFPVCDDYEPPFPFTGAVERVEIVIPHFAPRPDDAARSAADVAQALRHE